MSGAVTIQRSLFYCVVLFGSATFQPAMAMLVPIKPTCVDADDRRDCTMPRALPDVPARLAPESAGKTHLPAPANQLVGRQVVVVAEVAASGELLGVAIERSSRNRALDRAAMTHAATLRYLPAEDGGSPLASRVRVTIVFEAELPDA